MRGGGKFSMRMTSPKTVETSSDCQVRALIRRPTIGLTARAAPDVGRVAHAPLPTRVSGRR